MDESASTMSTDQDRPIAEELPTRFPPEVPPHFQFGISTMLWATLVTAVACTVLFPMPAVVAIPLILLIGVALPAVLTTIIIYGGSYQRTFCIGALFPSGVFLLRLPYHSMELLRLVEGGRVDDFEFRVTAACFWITSVVVGAICVGARRIVEKRPAA